MTSRLPERPQHRLKVDPHSLPPLVLGIDLIFRSSGPGGLSRFLCAMDAISAVVSTRWTARVFGDANLGDRRRNARLIRIVEGVADRPAGTIAEVFDNPADLCGAYDFIENDAIDPEALMACMARDAARHAVEHPFVWVATDGTSQTVTDRGRAKGTGPLGTTRLKGRGDKLHDALVMDPAGVPLGLCAVIDWQRAQTPARRSHGRRDVDQKETRYWLQARDQARTRLREFAPDVVLHFLHDREADSWTVLWDAVTHQNKEFTTVRAHWDRRLVRPDPIDDADARTLRDALARTTIRGELELTMPARGGQSARTATLSVRACRVTLDLRDKRHETHHAAPLNVVCVTEDSPPPGHAAVEWLLLTTAPVDTFEACVEVVRGYSLRWRIEELHRAWKSGATDLEASQLWTPRNRARWRLILAAVAVQLLRVKVLSETAPQTPATKVFTPEQIEAVRDLQKDEVVPATGPVSLWQMAVAIAYLGGWLANKRRPPGIVPLRRGWQRVAEYLIGLQRRNERIASLRRTEIPARHEEK
jgi:hypothetical protein